MDRQWSTGGYKPGVILKLSAEDNEAVGHNWMAGRLRDGDMAMVISHAGDCFWTYQLLEHGFVMGGNGKPGYRLAPGAKFGAYCCGERYRYQPNEREFHLLMAGESVSLASEPTPTPK